MIRTRSVTPKAAAAPPMPPKLDETSETGRVQIVAPLSWLAKIEEWRRAQPKIPSLSGAIRQLVDLGLVLPREMMARVVAVVGDQGVPAFFREAVERELRRRDKAEKRGAE